MLRIVYIRVFALLAACSQPGKEFGAVKEGITRDEVRAVAGEPSKESNIAIAELWTYETQDRTVVFRKDTVYQILTSAEARTDSLKSDIKNAGNTIKEKVNKLGDSLEKAADSTTKKLDGN